MPPSAIPLLAAGDLSVSDLATTVGGLAAIAASAGLLLVVPLYVTQSREIRRLLQWQQLEPHRGESAVAAAAETLVPSTRAPQTGRLSPAERVTVDRPALERITAERAALNSPSFWRRTLARGPRHPLVLSAAALLIAVAVVAVVAVTGPGGGEEPARGGGLDRSAVGVVVLNGSSQAGFAGKVADSLAADGFTEVRTGTTGTSRQTVVLFDMQRRREADLVARQLGVKVVQPLDRSSRAIAPDADVVVIAGEDRTRS